MEHSTETALSGFFKTKNTPRKGQNCLHQESILDSFRSYQITKFYLSNTQYAYVLKKKKGYFIFIKTNISVENEDANC